MRSMKHTRHPEIDEQVRVFGDNMRDARHRANLSQIGLAEVTGLDRAAISFLERADRAPDLSTLVRVARALNVKPGELLRGLGPADSSARGPRSHDPAPETRALHFGMNLRWARRRVDMSQETLAFEAKVDRAAISVYERGVREPNLRTVLKLSSALGLRPAALLRGIE
jgi:transcriptional regulator with XRE-family HTH domain